MLKKQKGKKINTYELQQFEKYVDKVEVLSDSDIEQKIKAIKESFQELI